MNVISLLKRRPENPSYVVYQGVSPLPPSLASLCKAKYMTKLQSIRNPKTVTKTKKNHINVYSLIQPCFEKKKKENNALAITKHI